MAKKLLLDGLPLWQHSVADIIDITMRLDHRPYDRGPTTDAQHNASVLHAFAGATERTTSELVAKAMTIDPDWSERFHALRLGESLAWGVRHRVVERVLGGHKWRLLEPERIFERIGGDRNERSLRVRGHATDAEAIEAGKAWQRELKRRENAKAREIEKHRPEIVRLLARICDRDPAAKLQGYLLPYVVGEHDSVAACRQLIIDSMDDRSMLSPYLVEHELEKIAAKLPKLLKLEPLPKDDIEALGGLRL